MLGKVLHGKDGAREMKPILRYPGSKWNIADWIISHMSAHTTYLEPFFGSGAIFFNKPPVIIAEDGVWHRPLTILELAALQGFPFTFSDGSPLALAGNSDVRWRERIGNAVPPPAAVAIGNQIFETLDFKKRRGNVCIPG